MEINASAVVKLREATGLGMMTCKKALIEAAGDTEKAIENLRKQGQMTAAKREGRAAKEGKVSIILKGADTLIYEVNSETDFVARNEDFLAFTSALGTILLEKRPADLQAAYALTSPAFNNQSVEARLLEIIGKIGEKISFRRFKLLSVDKNSQRTFSYIHGNGRIGVVVVLSANTAAVLDSQPFAELGKDIAMQVAAAKPLSVDRGNISSAVIEKEKEIYTSQVKMSGKPEKVWEKIVEGKLNKFYNQVVLLEQQYIKDPEKIVKQRIEEVEKDRNAAISISSFIRYELGGEE